MKKLHIVSTVLKENYGCHDWNGEDNCPQYWKFKGGNEYVLENFKDTSEVLQYMNEFYITINDLYYEYIVDVEEKYIADDEVYITDIERQQLEHAGKIYDYSKRIDLNELKERVGDWANWRLARTRQAQEYYWHESMGAISDDIYTEIEDSMRKGK